MKIEIPKNTWISDAQLEFAREGFFNGTLMVHLSFSGGSCPGDEFVAEVLTKLSKVPLPKLRKIVRFKGLFDPKDDSILLLIYSLKSYGFTVQAVIPTGFSASWIEKLDWLILRTEKSTPVLFNTNEVWYCPPGDQGLVEPQMPPKSKALLYLTKGRTLNETIKFMAEANNVWTLL